MTSNVTLNAGTGGAMAATAQITHDGDTAQLQLMGLMGITGTEDAYTVAKINGDATNGLDVDVTRVIPGTTATALGKAEDAAAASGDTGVALLTVRQDTPTTDTSADGDYQFAKTDSAGRLYVNASGVAVPITDNSGSLTVDNAGTFAVQAAQSGAWNITNISGTVSLPTGAATAAKQPALGTAGSASSDVITIQGVASMTPVQVSDGGGSITVDGTVAVSGSVATTNAGTFVTQENGAALTALQLIDNLVLAEDAAHASADPGVQFLTVRQDTPAGSTSADGDYQSAKTDSVGRVWVNGSGVTQPVSGTVTANLAAGTNTNEVVGDAAHDAPIAGNPLRIAGRGMSADYTAVATGDTADLLASLLGKQIVLPYALPGNTWSYAAASGGITNTTAVTVKAAAGAGIRNYVTHVDVVNGHATVDTEVLIRDGAAGTVIWRGFAKAAGGGVSADFSPPLRGTANTLLEVVNATTGAATYFNLCGFAAAE